MHELGDDRLGLQVIISVIVVAFVADRAVEALHDAVRLRVPRSGLDVDEVVGLDDGGDIAIHELVAPNPALAPALPVSARGSGPPLPAWLSVLPVFPSCSLTSKYTTPTNGKNPRRDSGGNDSDGNGYQWTPNPRGSLTAIRCCSGNRKGNNQSADGDTLCKH